MKSPFVRVITFVAYWAIISAVGAVLARDRLLDSTLLWERVLGGAGEVHD
jgi:hypothetical protein